MRAKIGHSDKALHQSYRWRLFVLQEAKSQKPTPATTFPRLYWAFRFPTAKPSEIKVGKGCGQEDVGVHVPAPFLFWISPTFE